MSIETFGFEKEDIKTYKYENFKGEKNKEYRISLVCETIEEAFVGVKMHFFQRPFICKSTKENQEICCTHNYEGNTAKWRVGCLPIFYDIKGEKLVSYEVKPWAFSEKVYNQLKAIHKNFPLDKHDIQLKCTNDQFQNFEILPIPKCLWRSNEQLKEKVLAEAEKLKNHLKKNLAREMPVSEIKELLGIEETGAIDAATTVDLGGIADDITA